MRKQSGQLPYAYTDPQERKRTYHDSLDCEMDTPERRAVPLTKDGIDCILALGYSRYRSPRPHLPEHTHPGCLEINFCQRGSLVFETRDESIALRPGNLFVPRSNEPHHLVTNTKGLYMYWMVFKFPAPGHVLLNLPKRESAALIKRLKTLPRNHFQAISGLRECFQGLFRLHDNVRPSPYRSLQMRALTIQLLLKLVESAELPPNLPPVVQVKTVLESIRRNPEKLRSIEDMARETRLSPSRFTTLFRQATGLPPHAFILNERLTSAKAALASGKEPLADIANRLGFSSPRHFSTLFKSTFGHSPSDIRKSAKGCIRPAATIAKSRR